jgi:uncharacterized protein YkwD
LKIFILVFLLLLSQKVSSGSTPTRSQELKHAVNELINQPSKRYDCGLHPKAKQLALLIINDSQQKRSRLSCNLILAQVAAQKAQEMAEKGTVTHYAGNVGANKRLIDAGYPLPDSYPTLYHNQVEAVAGGFSSADEVWQELKDSDGHRAHMLGEHSFYLEQDEIGVAFYRKWHSPHVEYWVVYIATQGNDIEAP